MSKLFVKWFGGMRPRMGDQHLTQRRLSETGYFRGPTVNKDAEVNVGNHATDATNCHLFSGELRPLKAPALAHTFCRPGDPCWRQPLPDDPSVPPVEPPEPPNCVPMVIESQSPEYNACLQYSCDSIQQAAVQNALAHFPLLDPSYSDNIPVTVQQFGDTAYKLYPTLSSPTWDTFGLGKSLLTPASGDSTFCEGTYCITNQYNAAAPGSWPALNVSPLPAWLTGVGAGNGPMGINYAHECSFVSRAATILDGWQATANKLWFWEAWFMTRNSLGGWNRNHIQLRLCAQSYDYGGGTTDNLLLAIGPVPSQAYTCLVQLPAGTLSGSVYVTCKARIYDIKEIYDAPWSGRYRFYIYYSAYLDLRVVTPAGVVYEDTVTVVDHQVTNSFSDTPTVHTHPSYWDDTPGYTHRMAYLGVPRNHMEMYALSVNDTLNAQDPQVWVDIEQAWKQNDAGYVDPDPNCVSTASHYLGDLPVGTVVPLSVTVNADATAPVTYQWYRNGVFIPNEVGPVYTLTVTAADSYATYFVLVQNPCGQGVSEEWSLGYTGYICLEYSCSAFIDAAIGVAPNVWPMDDPDRYPVGPQDRFYKDPRSTGSDDMLILPDPSGAIWDNVLHAGRFTVAGAFTDNYAPCQIYGIEYDVPGGAATTYTWRQTPAPNVGPQGPNINMAMVISDIPSNWIGSIGLHQTEFTYYDRWTGSTSTPDITMQAGFSDIGTQRRLFLSTPAVGDFAWLDVDESELFGGKATFLGIYLKFNRWEQNRIVSGTRYYVDFFFDYYLQINNHIVQGTYQWESNYTIYLEDLDTRYWTGTGGTNYYTSVYRAGGFRCVGLATNTYDAGPEWLSTVYEGYQRNFTTYVDPLCQ